jgi:transposase-like protein
MFGDFVDSFALHGEEQMPFSEVSRMDQRREFVRLAGQEGANITQLCRRFGISRTSGYKWLGRRSSGR